MNVQTSPVSEALARVELNDFPAWKRFVDFWGALFAITLFSPLIVIIGLIILFTDGRPVFFRQERLGRGGEIFEIYKFRSMRKDAEEVLRKDPVIYRKYIENNYKLPEGEDPRITRIGRFLRKTSLDELPQFFNVLRGEMSLVGPRPIVLEELKEYGKNASLFLIMKPGVTGAWQVSGRSTLKYPERALMELSYLDKQGFWFDFRTMFQTIGCVLKRTGAH